MATVFPSKRDLWISTIVWLSVLAMVAAVAPIWLTPVDWATRWSMTALLAVSAWFSLSVLYGTNYSLEQRQLLVRCGPLRWRVPYESILRVAPSRTWLSGPACSLDRLLVSRSDRPVGLVISPDDRERFLQSLASKCKDLELHEGQIIRSDDTR